MKIQKNFIMYLFVILVFLSLSNFNCVDASDTVSLKPQQYLGWHLQNVEGGEIRYRFHVLEAEWPNVVDILVFSSDEHLQNYLDHGNLSGCYYATGGWNGINWGSTSDANYETIELPTTSSGKTYYFILDNTDVWVSESEAINDIESMNDDGILTTGPSPGSNAITIQYDIEFDLLGNGPSSDGPGIYDMTLFEDQDKNDQSSNPQSNKDTFGFELFVFVLAILFIICMRKKI